MFFLIFVFLMLMHLLFFSLLRPIVLRRRLYIYIYGGQFTYGGARSGTGRVAYRRDRNRMPVRSALCKQIDTMVVFETRFRWVDMNRFEHPCWLALANAIRSSKGGEAKVLPT